MPLQCSSNSRQAPQQRERVEVDGDGAVAEWLLESDAHEAVGPGHEPEVRRVRCGGKRSRFSGVLATDVPRDFGVAIVDDYAVLETGFGQGEQMAWYVNLNGQTMGPVDDAQVLAWIQAGQLGSRESNEGK